jgi:hypothetical protein
MGAVVEGVMLILTELGIIRDVEEVYRRVRQFFSLHRALDTEQLDQDQIHAVANTVARQIADEESRDDCHPYDLDDMQDLDDGAPYIWNRPPYRSE